MSLSPSSMASRLSTLIDSDPEDLYDEEEGILKPDTSHDAFDAFAYYVSRAVIEEIQENAVVKAGIEVEDTSSAKIGETRDSSPGAIE